MGLTQIYSILTQKKAAQTVRAPLPRALINPQHSPASFNHKLAVIAALKTSPCSSCLKKLCLCHFIHQSVGRWSGDSWHRDGTGTSPVCCPGNSRCCWHWGWKLSASSSSGYPGIKCGVQRAQFSASSSSSGHPGIRCGVQHQRAVTAASGVAQSGWEAAAWWGSRGGWRRWGSSLPYLPEWNSHPREELSLVWAPGHGGNAALEQHISPCGAFLFQFSFHCSVVPFRCVSSGCCHVLTSLCNFGLYCTLWCSDYLEPSFTCRSLGF